MKLRVLASCSLRCCDRYYDGDWSHWSLENWTVTFVLGDVENVEEVEKIVNGDAGERCWTLERRMMTKVMVR